MFEVFALAVVVGEGVADDVVVTVYISLTHPIVRVVFIDDDGVADEVCLTLTVSPLFTVPAVVV